MKTTYNLSITLHAGTIEDDNETGDIQHEFTFSRAVDFSKEEILDAIARLNLPEKVAGMFTKEIHTHESEYAQ